MFAARPALAKKEAEFATTSSAASNISSLGSGFSGGGAFSRSFSFSTTLEVVPPMSLSEV